MKQLACMGLLVLLAAPAARAGTEEARAKVIPWSGHWWPMRKGQMSNGYRDGEAPPLRKHDRVTGAKAADWERKNHYVSEFPKWYGHCHAWAAAAVSEPEPTHKIRFKGETFWVGDVKAMLTESHYGDKATLFGERYTGPNCDPDDIHPDQLWKLMQDRMGEQGLPLLMDLDNTKEVWTYPVYGYRIEYQPDRSESDLYNCELTLFVTNTTVPPDYVGCLTLRKYYTFDVKMKDGVIEEGTGKWTGKSKKDHPDYAWYPASRGQENTELDYSLAHDLAEEASNSGDAATAMRRLQARLDYEGAMGHRDLAGDRTNHAPAGAAFVSNPALPDLAVRRRYTPQLMARR